jgi:predicted  nucleic acid-binding Zn-ribbon protein
MWKQLSEWLTQMVMLAKETQRNQEDIKQMRREIDEIAHAVERLAYEIKRTQDGERHEREKLALRLENEMLKFERRLPSSDKKDEK